MAWWDREHENCIVCGASLKLKRGDAKFCSGNCRKRWSRRKTEITNAAGDAKYALGSLRVYAKDYADLRPQVVEALRLLRTDIDDLLLMYDPEKQRDVAQKNELLISVSNRRNLS